MDFYRRTCLNCGHCISNIFPGNTISKKCYRELFPKIMKVKVKDQKALL